MQKADLRLHSQYFLTENTMFVRWKNPKWQVRVLKSLCGPRQNFKSSYPFGK